MIMLQMVNQLNLQQRLCKTPGPSRPPGTEGPPKPPQNLDGSHSS